MSHPWSDVVSISMRWWIIAVSWNFWFFTLNLWYFFFYRNTIQCTKFYHRTILKEIIRIRNTQQYCIYIYLKIDRQYRKKKRNKSGEWVLNSNGYYANFILAWQRDRRQRWFKDRHEGDEPCTLLKEYVMSTRKRKVS